MDSKDREVFKHLMAQYKHQYDLNRYARDNYDVDLEYYLGYRNKQEYPLAYNESFNRILPIIYTLLSRFMSQMYQSSDIVTVQPRKRVDVINAKSAEAVLNYQLENLNNVDMRGGSYLTMMKWFFNALTFGKGIIKAYWRKEERISPRRIMVSIPRFDNRGNFIGSGGTDYITQEMQTVYDGPYVEVLHNKMVVPHPEYKDIQDMPAFFIVYKKPLDLVKKLADKGIYKNVKEIGWVTQGGAGTYAKDSVEAYIKSIGIEGALHQEDLKSKLKSPDVDIIECYTKLILKDTPYSVGSGLKIKGEEEEAIIHIGNYKTILSIQRNPYGVRPLFDIGCYMQPEMYWDLGLVRVTKGIQKQIDTLGNLRMQNAMMVVNQMIRVDPDSDIPPEALIWKPFGIIPAEMGEIEPITIPDTASNLFVEQEAFYNNAIQDLTGMYSWSMGRTPERQEKTGVVQGITQMGESRAKLMLMSMDYLGIRPLLKYMMTLNAFHLPSGFEFRVVDRETGDYTFNQIFGDGLHADFDFSARYTSTEPALGKQYKANTLMQLARMWTQSPWINQYQFKKVILELLDVKEADMILRNPQQIMKEAKEQQQQSMTLETQRIQFETKQDLDKSRQDFQEQMALNEQQFGFDVALEAVKQEPQKD